MLTIGLKITSLSSQTKFQDTKKPQLEKFSHQN